MYFKLPLIIFFFLLVSCRRENQTIKVEKLPEITETGEGTFGFLKNDTVWIPKKNIFSPVDFFSPSSSYNEEGENNSGQLLIYAGRYNEDLETEEYIYLYADSVFSKGSYILRYNNIGSLEPPSTSFLKCPKGRSDKCIFFLNDNIIQDVINIEKIDTIRNIISGSFSLQLFSQAGKGVNISKGQFDLIYD